MPPAVDRRGAVRAAPFVGALAALALPAASAADDGLILRRAVVRPGELMTVWGGCREPIYLVPESFARRTGLLFFSLPAERPPTRSPFVFVGRTVCTRRVHYVGDFPDGDWSAWSGYLRFRVPPRSSGALPTRRLLRAVPPWAGRIAHPQQLAVAR